MRLDLNTNMELVGLREPFKATYKVTKNSRKSLKFNQTAAAISIFSSLISLLSATYPKTL